MKYIKKFNSMNESFEDTEYNHFCGIDISDIYSIQFLWTNDIFFSDYINHQGKYGDPELRIELGKVIREKLRGYDKDRFCAILRDGGLVADLNRNGFTLDLVGEDLIAFFYLVENINEYKRKKI